MNVHKKGMGGILAAMLFVAACGSSTPATTQTQSTMAKIQAAGTLVVGVNCIYKGTCFIDPTTKVRQGASVDFTNQLAKDLGVKVQWVDMDFSALVPALQTHKVDIVTQAITNTPARALVLGMTNPVTYEDEVLVLPKNSPVNSQTTFDQAIAALNQPGKTVVELLGSSQELIVGKYFPKATSLPLTDETAAFQDVATGRADAMIAGGTDALSYIQKDPSVAIWNNDYVISSEHEVWAVPSGESDFVDYLNQWIAYYQAEGVLRATEAYWANQNGIPLDLAGLPGSN